MDILLTIAIPAYNVEQYIEKCLDSFCEQEFSDKLEVLVIDDGSTDETAALTGKYCERYPDIFKLISKENGGHGSAINFGIVKAKGRYFKILDGDDWLDTIALKKLLLTIEQVTSCKENIPDIIATDFRCIQDQTGKILSDRKCTVYDEQYGRICSIKAGEVKTVIKMHSVTFKTSILQDNNIVIDEHMYYVDGEYITYPIAYCDSVLFLKETLYMYRLGRIGQSMDIQVMQRRKKQHLQVIHNMLVYYDKVAAQVSDNQRKYIELCIAQMIDNQFQIYISMGFTMGVRAELKMWDEQIKHNYPTIYKSTEKRSVTAIRKTAYTLLPIGCLVYRAVKGRKQ